MDVSRINAKSVLKTGQGTSSAKLLEGVLKGINYKNWRSKNNEKSNAIIEVLLLKELNENKWECLTKPAKRIKIGTIVKFSDKLSAKCIEKKAKIRKIINKIKKDKITRKVGKYN